MPNLLRYCEALLGGRDSCILLIASMLYVPFSFRGDGIESSSRSILSLYDISLTWGIYFFLGSSFLCSVWASTSVLRVLYWSGASLFL